MLTEGTQSKAQNCLHCSKTKRIYELKSENGYWRKLHEKAKERCQTQEKEITQLKARIRYLNQKKYGRKSEKKQSKAESRFMEPDPARKRKRGGQKGSKGGQPRDYSNLPEKAEYYDIDAKDKICPLCGKLRHKFKTTDDSCVLEIEVKAYRRTIRKYRYSAGCRCTDLKILTARGPEKLLSGGLLGISIWTEILYRKYGLGIPVNRTLKDFQSRGLDIAPGTVGDGLKKLAGLFKPIYHELITKNQSGRFFQADETRWSVFELKGGKKSFRWYLWLFMTKECVVHVMDPSRAAQVIEDHLGNVHEGILVVDRYSAYKSFAKKHSGIILAFCWAHCRGDFLEAACKYPKLKSWADQWIARIAELYHINNERILHAKNSQAHKEKDDQLRTALCDMKKQAGLELQTPRIHYQIACVLTSLQNHWDGLTVFVDRPTVPMDNNNSERTLRNSVIGRKNYFGSGNRWSAELAAVLFSMFETLKLNQRNEREWLYGYLTACAINGGRAPANIVQFLPWKQTDTVDRSEEKETPIAPPKRSIAISAKTNPGPEIIQKAGDFTGFDFLQPRIPNEVRLWDEYIERYHYLGHTTLPGDRLRYFISSHDRLLALMGFNSAAWRVQARDDFIGWNDEQRIKNLRLIINNARFLILPWVKSENLASRLLSVCVKRVADDWESVFSYRPVLLETFVDSSRFNGACYRASNWLYAGMTKGRGKFGHDKKNLLTRKYVFLFPLQKNFRFLLC